MVIGFDAKRAFCNATGLGNYSRGIISGLASVHPEDTLRLYTPFRKAEFAHAFDHLTNVAVKEPASKRKGGSLWRTFGIAAELRREPLDLYHGLSHELPQGMPSDIPAVVTIHDLAPWRYPSHFPLLDRTSYRNKMRHACHRADTIVAVSTSTKNDLMEFLNVPEEKIVVVGQSCHPRFWEPVSEVERIRVKEKYNLPEKYVITVGTIEPRKNQLTAVRALAKVNAEIALVIVGHPKPYNDRVCDEMHKLGLEQRVIFIHEADSEDLPALYSRAVCSLYLSLYEGFGIPVLESMCCGTPVVCSNQSSLPEVGGDAAVLVEPEDDAALSASINRIVSDADYRDTLVERSRIQADRFRQEKVVNELYEVYQRLLRKGVEA